MLVVILSTPDDVHAIAVSKCLNAIGADSVILSADELNIHTEVRLSLDSELHSRRLLLQAGRELDLDSVNAIWFRRSPIIRYVDLPESWMNAMVENELRAAFYGMFRSLDCLFVNHPGRDFDCSFKLFQLEAARRAGFAIPKTLVTSTPKIVEQFYNECNGQVVYKLISETTNFSIPKYEPMPGIPTLPLRHEDLPHLHQVSLAPHFFQERIEKQFDIRVTAIGKKLFPVRIDSQLGEGSLDWRKDYSVPMSLISLPPEIHNACLTLLKELGLNYGAIDLCLDTQGRYIFFEINCAGQFLWIEPRVEGLNLSLELAKLLAGESEPMIPARQHAGRMMVDTA